MTRPPKFIPRQILLSNKHMGSVIDARWGKAMVNGEFNGPETWIYRLERPRGSRSEFVIEEEMVTHIWNPSAQVWEPPHDRHTNLMRKYTYTTDADGTVSNIAGNIQAAMDDGILMGQKVEKHENE